MLRPLQVACCALAPLVLVAATSAASAEPASASSAPDAAETIADHVRRGDKARKAGRWRDAAAAYAEALAAAEQAGLPEEQRAAIVGELGAAEVALGEYRDGAEHLHRSLMHEDGFRAEQRQRLRLARTKAAGQVIGTW